MYLGAVLDPECPHFNVHYHEETDDFKVDPMNCWLN
jgi:hypothetical protein